MSPDDAVRPAMSAEEWGWLSHEGEPMPPAQLSASLSQTDGTMELGFTDCYDITTRDRHALAALCLHGQPFGFTREDVELVADVKGAVVVCGEVEYGTEGHPTIRAILDRLDSLANRIEALLPPATPTPSKDPADARASQEEP